jgi:hypothetical protein
MTRPLIVLGTVENLSADRAEAVYQHLENEYPDIDWLLVPGVTCSLLVPAPDDLDTRP